VEKAASALNSRGAMAVLVGRFTAVLRAMMPALAGTARMPYRTFAVYNAVGGLIWGVGYCLLGYLAGSAYEAVEREVGAGFAIAIAALVVAVLVVWAVRRTPGSGVGREHRSTGRPVSLRRARAERSRRAPRRAPPEGRHGLRAMKSSPRCRFLPALPAGPS
jgi:hypothetical protein